mgnify:CR=1 FL=1
MTEEVYESLITPEELSEILAVGKNTAYRLLNEGKISAFRIGRIWKIPRKAVWDYIRENSRPAASGR